MVDWTDEAIKDARKSLPGVFVSERDMRAALDAAVKAQFAHIKRAVDITELCAFTAGRAEAFEEAAKRIEEIPKGVVSDVFLAGLAGAIRALAPKPPK